MVAHEVAHIENKRHTTKLSRLSQLPATRLKPRISKSQHDTHYFHYRVSHRGKKANLKNRKRKKKGRKEGASNIYFAVEDLDAEYKRLSDRSVKFIEPPKKQYWGGYAALFADPDENLFYLVEVKNEA